jgi:hypothetical protein
MPAFECSLLFLPPRTRLAVGPASFWLFAREGGVSEDVQLAKEADVGNANRAALKRNQDSPPRKAGPNN